MNITRNIFSWRWLVLLFAAVAISASFTACGGDDDDPSPDEEQTSSEAKLLIGTWVYDGGEYSWGYTFKNGGNGVEFESYYGNIDRWPITWDLDGKHLQITDSDGDKENLTIKHIDDEFLSVQFDDGDVRDLERAHDTDEPESSVSGKAKELVGLWCHEGSSYTDWTRFNADGSGFMDASDRYGTDGDYFTNYRVRFDATSDTYYLDIRWTGYDAEEWDTDSKIDFVDKETIRLNWGSGWYTYYKQ